MIAQQLTQQAIEHANNGDQHAARLLFTEVVKCRPDDSNAWLNLGVCCLNLNDLASAAAAFERCLNLNPNTVAAYSNLAALWVARDEFDRALNVLDEGLQQTDSHPLLLATQGALLAERGEFSAAFAALGKAHAQMPRQVDVALLLAELLLQKQHYTEALAVLNSVIELPDAFAARFYLAKGGSLYGLGQVAAATTSLAQAQRAGASQASALLTQITRGWGQTMASKRLRLEPLNSRHADDLYTLGDNQPAWAFYNPQGISAASPLLLQREIQRRYAALSLTPSELAWTVYRQHSDTQVFIGLCQLVQIDHRNHRAELLMILNTCGRGFGVELLILVLETFFNRYGLHKLIAYVVDSNRDVLNMCLRLGFTQEGTLQQHLYDPDNGRYSDLLQLAMLAENYRQSHKLQRFTHRFQQGERQQA